MLNGLRKKEGYEAEFYAALKLTRKWQLSPPEFVASKSRIINENTASHLQSVIQKNMGKLDPEHVSQQCFSVTEFMQEELEIVLNTRLFYTLGYVEFFKKPVFHTPIEGLDRMRGRPPQVGAVNLHAWLTTPAFEIIDLTFSTTYGIVNNQPDVIGRIAASHYSEFNEDLIYRPQLVGDNYLRAIGALLDFDFTLL